LVLPEVGPEGQKRLKGSSTLVVGVGGLGIPAAVYLASAGGGRVGLVDHDTVEMPNLQRQFIFSESDIGRKKVEVARDRLYQTNPNVEITTYDHKLDSSNALDVLRQCDVVIDATDNLPSPYLVNDAWVILMKPDIYASVLGFDGQASVSHAEKGSVSGGACYLADAVPRDPMDPEQDPCARFLPPPPWP